VLGRNPRAARPNAGKVIMGAVLHIMVRTVLFTRLMITWSRSRVCRSPQAVSCGFYHSLGAVKGLDGMI